MSDELKLARIVKALAAFTLSLSTPALAAESIKINDLVVAATTRGDPEGSASILRFLEHRPAGPLHRHGLGQDRERPHHRQLPLEDNLTLLQEIGVAKVDM